MKNTELWQESKFVIRNNKLRANLDTSEVRVGSRVVADLNAKHYQDNIEKYAKGRLLDFGCGKAPLYGVSKKNVDDVICIDWENSAHGNSFLDYVQDLNDALQLPDQQFDTVLSTDVLEHLRNPSQVFSEIYRVLKKDGRLILAVPFFYGLHEEPYDYYRYTKYALRMFAEDAGFEVVELKETGGLPEILLDLFMKALSLVPFLAHIAWTVIGPVIHSKLFELISLKTRDKFPMGYILVARKIS